MENSSTPPLVGINLDPWRQVTARADAFFDQVAASCGEHLRCAAECVDCCQQDLEVLAAEALAILHGLEGLPPATLRALERGADHAAGACVLLLDRRCAVYDARPLICRTHGLPIRYGDLEDPDAEAGVSCCALNFVEADPPAGAVLNGTLLLAGLSVADSLVRQQLGAQKVSRIPISRLLASRWDALAEVRDKNR